MKKILSVAIFALFSVALVGCGGSSSAGDHPRHDDYVPELRIFDIIDSYDTDTANPNHPALAFTPFLHDGVYEIFWEVNSLEDYEVTLRINDRPSLTNSLAIHSQVCGEGRRCDQSGNWICEYTREFYMSCDGSTFARDVYPLISKVPQQVYLFLEVCDSNSGYCEYDYYPVTLE